jgi:hypothetical protein
MSIKFEHKLILLLGGNDKRWAHGIKRRLQQHPMLGEKSNKLGAKTE